jgi:hypothetical protein
MLKTPMNEWAIKALQLETALLALEEAELPAEMKALQDKADQAMRQLLEGWNERKPQSQKQEWKMDTQPGGQPQDEELGEVVTHLKEEGLEWTVHRATNDKGEKVETLLAEDRGWMAAGGEYYSGQWDAEQQVLEVGRDDEEDEPGTGLVFNLQGELLFESMLDEE